MPPKLKNRGRVRDLHRVVRTGLIALAMMLVFLNWELSRLEKRATDLSQQWTTLASGASSFSRDSHEFDLQAGEAVRLLLARRGVSSEGGPKKQDALAIKKNGQR